jgi:hypothetical protein
VLLLYFIEAEHECRAKECGASCTINGIWEIMGHEPMTQWGACDANRECSFEFGNLGCEIDIMALPISSRQCCVDGRGCCTGWDVDRSSDVWRWKLSLCGFCIF